MRRTGGAIAAIVVVVATVLAVFAPVVGYAFVYDDHWTIEKTPGLAAPLGRVLSAVFRGQAGKLGLADATRPTMVLSTWLDRHAFGLDPAGFHAHSLLLYLAVCLLAWRVLLVLTGRPRAALFGALFFAVAPMHAEVVASVNYREDLLATFFSLIVLHVIFAPRRFRAERAGALEASVVAVATLLAIGGKESAFVLPVLVLAIAWARGDDLAFLRRRETLLTAVVIVTALMVNWRLGVPDDVPRTAEKSWMIRAFATGRYEAWAAFSSFVPFFWAPERARPQAAGIAWLFALAGLVALVVYLRRRWRLHAVALAIVLVAPLASSPLVGPVNELADRYVFLSILGGALSLGLLADRLPRRLWAVPIAVIMAGAISASFARAIFRDDHELWAAAVKRAPDSARAWTGLSRVHRLEGNLDAADDAIGRALSLDPSYAPAKLTRAYNLLARGNVVEARPILFSLADGEKKLAGLAHAEACAALESDAARACITR
ncbi:MAG: tetratricopeptide repeat protein [Polyangiales bacterium]